MNGRKLPRPIQFALHALTERLFEPRLDVTHISLPVRDLPPALDGFVIAHLSDLHLGERPRRPFHLDEVVDRLHHEEPDVVVNTGDFILDGLNLDLVANTVSRLLLPPDERKASPRNLAVLGNHDYFPGEEATAALKDRLRSMGVTVLENGSIAATSDGSALTFVGLAPHQNSEDLERVIEELRQATGPRIVLVHAPDSAELLPPKSADLILSGHTHGGQIAPPGLRRWSVRYFAASKYAQGLYTVNGMPLYVNRGLGYSGFPLRIRAAPEIAFIRLIR